MTTKRYEKVIHITFNTIRTADFVYSEYQSDGLHFQNVIVRKLSPKKLEIDAPTKFQAEIIHDALKEIRAQFPYAKLELLQREG